MSDTFHSCRDAVAYALSHRRGPRMARQAMGEGPSGYRSQWDGCAVRACMRIAGVAPDSHEERALADWAQADGPKPVEVERRLRRILDEHGLLSRDVPVGRRSLVEVTWTDPETGAELRSLGETRS